MDSAAYQANRMIGDQGYPAFELRNILGFVAEHFGPARANTLLKEVGLDENTVIHSQFVAVWQVDYALNFVFELAHDPEVGARIGAGYQLSELDILLPHFASCKTLGDCLDVVMQLPRLVGSLSDTLVMQEGNELVMRWMNTGKQQVERYHNVFLHSIGVLLTLARELTGVQIEYTQLAFQRAGFAAHYIKSLTTAELTFAQPYCEWRVSAEYLSLPVVYDFSDAAGQMPPPLEPSLIDLVLEEIRSEFPQIPKLESLAASLNMSDRSLRRKLSSMDTGYQSLIDMVRAQAAIARLLKGELSITEIAETLGYVDVSHFRQSFKHWTGHAPGHFVRLNCSSPEKGEASLSTH
ncbi:AraC family transcriptional regulator [Shewanella submarina]|uniref:Helix-turn-helix domain-containing protein n=1 Tax=Shewanella submarina TaxID=2016376 RepID=A0ABV7GDV4_9GAMM|nr:AraC family transcriptional regulator [Shewanella submarina]MCL1036623.1 AraC family transcriptional regulator [Shewanella submarina]